MSSFIHDIEIANFKSIRHQKIEGCKRINVFIGYPNVGKSNILEAMSLLSFVNAGVVTISELCRVEKFSELFFDGNIKDGATVSYSKTDSVRLIFNTDTNLSLGYWIKDNGDNTVWSIVKRFILQPAETLEDDTIDSKIAKLSNFNLDLHKISVKKYEFHGKNLKGHARFNSLSYPSGINLFFILETNRKLRKQVAELFIPYQLKLAFEQGNDYTLRILKNLDDETIFLIPFHQIADTLQRLIFYKAAIASNQDTVLLFEEPEAHMFPPYIKLFTNDIVDGKSNQYFINTHSPFVLNELMEHGRDELSVFTVGLKNGETTIKRLTDEELEEVHQYGVDLFFNLESYL